MPKIIDLIKGKYLYKNNSINKNELIKNLDSELNIPIEKIKKKILKLIKKGDLELLKGDNIILPIKFDEQEEIGDFILGRKGREVYLKNTSNHKLTHNESKNISEKAIEDLTKTLKKLEKELLQTNPLKVLTYFSRITGTKNINELGKDIQELQISLEIIQKIILKHKKEEFQFNDNFDIKKIEFLIKDLKTKILNYCIFYDINGLKDDFKEKPALISLRTDYLVIRGEAYQVHYDYIYENLFKYTRSCFSINLVEFYNQMKAIENQIDLNIQNPSLTKQKMFEKNIESMYKINTKKIKKEYLDLLNLKLGENEEWTSIFDFDKILTKPIIKHNNKYYCFIPQHLLRNKKLILENLLQKEKREEYKKLKGQFFELEVKKAFEKILNSTGSYINLFTKEKNSSEKDLIIIKENLLFIIEIKGTKRRLFSTDLNIIEQTKEDFQVSIKKAFKQVNDTYNYLLKYNEAVFYDSNDKQQRKEILKLKKKDYKKVFKISVHADSFFSLTSCLDNIKSIDSEFYENSKDFWTVNLYDLLIFKDIIETPEDFLEYLEQRLGLNSNKELVSDDEIDLLGYFLNEGNLKLSKDITKGAILSMFSEEINKYFESLSIKNIEIEKPKRKQ